MLGQPRLEIDLSRPGIALYYATVNGRRFYGRSKPEIMAQIVFVPSPASPAGPSRSRFSH